MGLPSHGFLKVALRLTDKGRMFSGPRALALPEHSLLLL